MAFFVMSFVDLVGIGVDRVSRDMNLSATLAQLIPSAAFLWFFLLSVPMGILQSRYGKRTMLNAGMGVTALGLLLPFMLYKGEIQPGGELLYDGFDFGIILAGFALLGIGNTIVQVSANPLLVDVVPGNRTSSFLSFSQFVKAIGSMIGAPLAGIFAAQFGDWKLLFLVFGIVSILAVVWLGAVKVDETATVVKATFGSSFKLLVNGFVLMMVVSIFLVVGVDVGFNSNSGNFLVNKFGIDPDAAEKGRSVYFLGRMIGTFTGALLLTRITTGKFLLWTTVLGILCFVLILFTESPAGAWALVFMIGLAVANIWPLVFSLAVRRYPDRSNEISGLMMMAISGGAVIPLLAGWASDKVSVTVGMSVLLLCMVYLFIVSLTCQKDK